MQSLRNISCCSCRKVRARPRRHAPRLAMVDICHSPIGKVGAPRIAFRGTQWVCAGRLSARCCLQKFRCRVGDMRTMEKEGPELLKRARLAMTMGRIH